MSGQQYPSFGMNIGCECPFADLKAFYDRRFDAFYRFRYAVESYYLHQQDSRADPRGLDAAGIALPIYRH